MPVITITGLQIGNLIAFALVTETVFQWPGMGLLFIQAVTFVDIPVMAAYLLVVSFIFVSLNTMVDLLYAVVDPRLRSDAVWRRRWPLSVVATAVAARAPARRRYRAGASAARPVAIGAGARARCSSSLTALVAPLIAPQNPYDLTQLFLDKAELPPIWQADGEWPYLLGTDPQGRDVLSAILYGSRISLVIGLAERAARDDHRRHGRARRRLLRRLARQSADADRRHGAVDPDAAGRDPGQRGLPRAAAAGAARQPSRPRSWCCRSR